MMDKVKIPLGNWAVFKQGDNYVVRNLNSGDIQYDSLWIGTTTEGVYNLRIREGSKVAWL